ncbi:NAD-dependent epimerase/dehydratase family protein [Bizionia argentinensis JUB59]|uniref:NAD-dependent epimerase/dehydratase family protein n=1 Tax=Bizionia argentinensis JUB59 TaxID=1046627 RepID=G2EHG7_9FLAO|nr:NAD-dependent epimerase/dehydratase family protein [Bizionia argentinensis]EGV42206.1 NAD-dependent epimerase/dehydratase family protein [Bizionia argentinensis JUB59]
MILVTGGTGLVGSHLLYQLVYANKSVRAIYRTEEKQDVVKRVFSYYSDDFLTLFNKIEWVEADLLNIPKLSDAFKNVDYVYHCAAMVSFAPNDYHKLRKTNIEGTTNIVNLSISNHIKKLCYVSSVAAIGENIKNEPSNEENSWNKEKDNSVYAITKYGAEIEVWRGTQEGLDAVIVNPGVILGPGLWNQGTGEIFKQVKGGLPFYTKGHVACIDVFDVVKIMIDLLESPIKNDRFILVADHVSYKEFLGMIAKNLNAKAPYIEAKSWLLGIVWRLDWLKHKLTGKPRKLVKHMVKSTQNKVVYDNTKIKNQLNYKFTPISESIASVAEKF